LNIDPVNKQFDQIPASQLSSLLLRWCQLAKPFLQATVGQPEQLREFPAALSAVGVLLSALGGCLQSWVHSAAAGEQDARKRQIAQSTAGG
jgi:hypothetical protein